MKISGIRLTNWMNHRDTSINCDRLNIICGLNNVGKSAIAEGIQFAILGSSPRLPVKGRSDRASGEVEIDLDGIGTVKRTVSPHTLQVAELHGGLTDQQVELLHLLGTSSGVIEAVLNTTNFIQLDQAGQKEILLKVLGLSFTPEQIKQLAAAKLGDPSPLAIISDKLFEFQQAGPEIFDSIYKSVFELRRDYKRDLKRLESQGGFRADPLPNGAKAADLPKAEALLKTLRAERDSLIGKKGEAEAAGRDTAAITELQGDIDRLEEEATAIETDGDAYSALEKERENQSKELEEIKADIAAAEKNIAELRIKIGTINSILESTGNFKDNCLVLTSLPCPISKADIDRFGKEQEEKRSKLEKDLSELKYALESTIRRRDDIASDIKRIDGEMEAMADLKVKRGELYEEAKRKRGRLDKITADIAALDGRISKGESLIKSLRAAEAAEKMNQGYGEKLKLTQATVDQLEKLCEIFGPKGLVADLIGEKIGAIQDRASASLAMLTGQTYQIAVQIGDTVSILITLPSGQTVPLSELSHSEQLRIGIVLQDAIANLSGLRFLLIDNAEMLDSDNRLLLSDMIRRILESGNYDQIFVIATLTEKRDEHGNLIIPEAELPGEVVIYVEDGAVREPAVAGN